MAINPVDRTQRPRVVITGMGAITPLGSSVEETWSRAARGESGIDQITLFDASSFPSRIAGEVRNFDLLVREYVGSSKYLRYMNRSTVFAFGASAMAWRDSGLDGNGVDPTRLGVAMGVGVGNFPQTAPLEELSAFFRDYYSEGGSGPQLDYRRVVEYIGRGNTPRLFQKSHNTTSALLAIKYGAKGACATVVTACASSTQALGEAYRWIQQGDTDVVIAGGCDAPVNELSVTGFCLLSALSRRNDKPQQACRPFDRKRDGFILAEGAGVVILEELGHARRRGATVYGEIIGYGSSADAFRVTDPPEDGSGAARAMRAALLDAGIAPPQVEYVNAHGTSTYLNDKCETKALKSVFGQDAYGLPVSSTKSTMGHLVAAAGAVELIVTVRAMEAGLLPPTINFENPDRDCDLDYVPNAARRARVNVALSNSFAFGGHNASLVMRRPEGRIV